MLKRIVKLFKTQPLTSQNTADLFARRFGEAHTDRHQWNGGRHLSAKELQISSVKSTGQYVS